MTTESYQLILPTLDDKLRGQQLQSRPSDLKRSSIVTSHASLLM